MNTKKALLLVVALVLVIMAGCSAGNSSGGNSGGSGSGSDSGSGSGGTSGNLPEEITIGALIPMTGTGASYGVMDQNGADLAVEQINAAGGVKGIKIKVKYEDHQAKPQVAVNAINRLISVDKTPYVLSSYSSVSLAVAPIGDSNQVVVMNAGGQSDNLANAGDYFYNNIPLVGGEVEIIADYLYNEMGFKTAAVVYVNDDGGRSSLNIFKKEFTKHGGQVVAEEATELGGADYRAALTKVKSANPDVVFVGAYGQDTALIIKQARELGIEAPIAETSWSVIPDVYALPEAEGLIHTALHFEPDQSFKDAFISKYGTEPALYNVTFYDGVMIFAQALEWVIDNNKPINGASIKEAIDTLKRFDGVAGDIVFRDDHTTLMDVDISVLKNGTPEVVKTYKVN
jgi:ABC-type branched-subunit amino acid transport system substrate-binding protein